MCWKFVPWSKHERNAVILPSRWSSADTGDRDRGNIHNTASFNTKGETTELNKTGRSKSRKTLEKIKKTKECEEHREHGESEEHRRHGADVGKRNGRINKEWVTGLNTNWTKEGMRCRWTDTGNRAVLRRPTWDRWEGRIRWGRSTGGKQNTRNTEDKK